MAITAKVLIGADGAFSGVRRQCLADGKPKSPVRTHTASSESRSLCNDSAFSGMRLLSPTSWIPAEAMVGVAKEGAVECEVKVSAAGNP